MGLVLVVVVHAASIQDRSGAKTSSTKAHRCHPRMQRIWADGGYAKKTPRSGFRFLPRDSGNCQAGLSALASLPPIELPDDGNNSMVFLKKSGRARGRGHASGVVQQILGPQNVESNLAATHAAKILGRWADTLRYTEEAS